MEVRGQFSGHYLSALALALRGGAAPADDLRARCDAVVAGLAECQAAWGDGYVAAFPKSFLDRLFALDKVWAPLYVLHKILAGLLDAHVLAGQAQALGVATGLADYLCGRFERVVEEQGREHWEAVLETEFGGMNEASACVRLRRRRPPARGGSKRGFLIKTRGLLIYWWHAEVLELPCLGPSPPMQVLYNMYIETGRASYARCAALFDKPSWFGAMVEGRDTLAGLHANTHLAQASGRLN